MNQMTKVHASLFSGIGAADLAASWMGWNNAFWCEIEDFPRYILSYWFPKSKGYGNIKETDFTPWRGKIDVLTGGFPCQPFSVAGQRKGAADDRYLWPEMLRAIREIRPTWVIGENVGGIVSMVQPGSEVTVESQTSLFEASDKETILEQVYVVETVCRSLEREGYSVQPIVIPACAIGAPHRRDRIFFVAHRTDAGAESVQQERKDEVYLSEITSYTNSERCDNRSDNREKRSVYHDKKRHTPEDKPKRQERQRRDCKDSSATSNSNQKGFPAFGFTSCVNKEEWENKDRYLKQYPCNVGRAQRTDWWEDFPTQPSVCRGNDGLPFNVDGLAIPFTKWR